MLTGVVAKIFLTTNSFCSKCLSSWAKILGEMPSTSFMISLKRLGVCTRLSTMGSFHFPFNTYNASVTFLKLPEHSALEIGAVSFVSVMLQR